MKQVGRYLYHVAAPANRSRIEQDGIVPHRGEQWLSNTPIEGKAVFATNSEDKEHWFESGYDDDIWRIDSTKIPDVVWHPDPNITPQDYIWVYTHSLIPREAVELIKKGSGESLEESKKLRNIVRKVIAELAQKRERVYIGKNVVREVVQDEQHSSIASMFAPYKKQAEDLYGVKIDKFLGSGSWGAAYSTTNNKVLKFTYDSKEYEAARPLIGRKNTYLVDLYGVEKLGKGNYAILMEKIQPMNDKYRKDIENFDRLIDKQDIVGAMSVEIGKSWADILSDGYNEDTAAYLASKNTESNIMSPVDVYKNLLKIYEEAEDNGVMLTDMHLENLGIKNGHLAALDLS